jgi:hypothetical protein
MAPKTNYIKTATVRRFLKANGRRVSSEFLLFLDRHIETKLLLASKEHNGGKKTLDTAVAAYILGNK